MKQQEKWFFLAFRPSFVPLEEIVGGDQVRPYELFINLARSGHKVHIWETDGKHTEERSYCDGQLIVKPLRYSFGLLSFIPQYLEMRSTLQSEVKKAREEGFSKLCFYNQVPCAVVFRFGILPMLTQPGILLFDLAKKLGMKTWGNMHDLSPDHELGARERVSKKIKMRNIRLTASLHAWIQKTFIPKSDFVSTGSLAMKEALIERYDQPEEKITVMEAGYNQSLMEQLKPWSPPPNGEPWTVAYLGSHIDAQLDVLIEALNVLGDKSIRLLLAGRGMQEAVDAQEVSWPNIEVVNGAKYSSFAEVANKVDIWAVPLTDRVYIEIAWPLKMPMYLASGRPVVRTRGKALDDTGLGELFFQAGMSAKEFSETLQSVIQDPESALKKTTQAKEVLSQRFTWERITERMLAGLERTL